MIHPAFTGCLTLAISNLSGVPIQIYPGMQAGQVVCHQCPAPSDAGMLPQRLNSIPAPRRYNASPMHWRMLTLVCCLTLLTPLFALADTLAYRARVVHNNRAAVSYVAGEIDLASGDFAESVERSFNLDWQRLPGRLAESRPALPAVWRAGGKTASQYAGAPPRFDGELLRHFILGHVIAGADGLKPEQEYLSGQLIIGTADVSAEGFEIVASFRGTALVIVGRYHEVGGVRVPSDFAVLGASSELYQYFFTDARVEPGAPASPITLPAFNPADYVTFPTDGAKPVAIRPVKDWLVFQAELPNGRPLNLVFDSGAETMILDDWVLQLDSDLMPVGELPVAGGLASGTMRLYEGFCFNVGGVEFRNLAVAGSQLTMLGFGADLRIHGIVGGDILRLCQLDLDLAGGELRLFPMDSAAPQEGEAVPLTLIQDMPHVTAQVHGTGDALLLLDTGQRTSLQVNLDWLDSYQLGDELMLNGFLGDVAGGLAPRYIIEQLDLQLGQERYTEKTVDASLDSTYTYDGLPVVGAIGFPLLARHFGGITFDYSDKLVYLRDPGDHTFLGQPEAWKDITIPPVKRTSPWQLRGADGGAGDGGAGALPAEDGAPASLRADSGGQGPPPSGTDSRRPALKLRSAQELREDLDTGALPAPVATDALALAEGSAQAGSPDLSPGVANANPADAPARLTPLPEPGPADAEVRPTAETPPHNSADNLPQGLFTSVAQLTRFARVIALAQRIARLGAERAARLAAGQPAEATEPETAPDVAAAGAGTRGFSQGKSKLRFDSTYQTE